MKESNVGLLTIAAFVLTGIAASAQDETKQDPLQGVEALRVIPGCVSLQVIDEKNKTSTVYKRERPCEGETPREEKK